MKKEKRFLSKREAVLLILVLGLAALLSAWKFVYLPWHDTYRSLQKEKSVLQEKIDQLEQELRRKPEIEAEWRRWNETGRELEETVPTLEQIPQVLADLEVLLQKENVAITRIVVSGIQRLENQAVVSFQLGLEGEQRSTLNMLSRLERFQRLLVVDSVAWKKNDSEKWSMDLMFALLFKL